MPKDKKKKAKKRFFRVKGFGVFVVVLLIVGVATCFLLFDPNTKNIFKQINESTQRKDGKPESIVEYHQKALEAWKNGDKKTAQDYAQKVIDENQRMTTENQAKVPNQAGIMNDAVDIKEGLEPL